VNSSGISISQTTPSLISGFNQQIKFVNGLINATSGAVVDPVA